VTPLTCVWCVPCIRVQIIRGGLAFILPSHVSKSLDILRTQICFVYSVRLPLTVNEAWEHQTHVRTGRQYNAE